MWFSPLFHLETTFGDAADAIEKSDPVDLPETDFTAWLPT